MKRSISTYKYHFSKLFRQHQGFVVIVTVLCVLLLVFLRINMLGNIPLDQNYLKTQMNNTKSVKFNEDAVEKIKALNESNVTTPGTELPGNRQNPFSE